MKFFNDKLKRRLRKYAWAGGNFGLTIGAMVGAAIGAPFFGVGAIFNGLICGLIGFGIGAGIGAIAAISKEIYLSHKRNHAQHDMAEDIHDDIVNDPAYAKILDKMQDLIDENRQHQSKDLVEKRFEIEARPYRNEVKQLSKSLSPLLQENDWVENKLFLEDEERNELLSSRP